MKNEEPLCTPNILKDIRIQSFQNFRSFKFDVTTSTCQSVHIFFKNLKSNAALGRKS